MRSIGVAVAAGAVTMVVAWYQASGTLRVDDQVHWASMGLVGAVLMSGSAVAAVSVAQRRMRQRCDSLQTGLEPCLASIAAGTAAVSADDPVTEHGVLVATTNMVHYHRPGCFLVAAKPAQAAPRAEHERAGRATCAICEP